MVKLFGVSLQHHLMTGAAIMAVAVASPAMAQTRQFNIPAQPASRSIPQFARQAGAQIIASGNDVADRRTNAVRGNHTVQEGLRILLEGTGLSADATSSGGIITIRAIPSSGEAGAAGDAAANQVAPAATVLGQVRAEGSPVGLPGALVRLSTGQTTTTDIEGRFRLIGVPPGNHLLTASYLGFAEGSAQVNVGQDTGASGILIVLPNQISDGADVVVYGSRSSRAIALNQERTAENTSTVVSADQLGDFPGTTIAEALRRSPAISFQQDPLTGDGTNIIIRGLAPDLNQVTLNGVRLPEGSGTGRSPSLNNILADSIERITISETLLANQDSAGTGGLVEIETKSPLNGPLRYASLTVEGGLRGRDFSQDFLASGTVSGTFGSSRNFGLSLSVQYRTRRIDSIQYSTNLALGQFLPLEADGSTSIFGPGEIDPRLDFPFEPGATLAYPDQSTLTRNSTDSTNLTITATAAWQIGNHTELRLDYVHAATSSDTFQRQVSAIFPTFYAEQPVAALGGEPRQALTWNGTAFIRHNYQDGRFDNRTDNLSFRGTSHFGDWNIAYNLGYARGRTSAPDARNIGLLYGTGAAAAFGASVDPTLLLADATDPMEGRILSPFGPRTGRGVPLPLLSPEGWATFNDPANYYMSGFGSRTNSGGENARASANIDLHRDFQGGHLRYIEAGVGFETSKFSTHVDGDSIRVLPQPCADPGDFLCVIFPTYPTIADFGLRFTQSDLARIGQAGQGFDVLSRDSVFSFWNGVDSNPLIAITPLAHDPRSNQQFTRENSLTAYVQARFDIGRLETIIGVRYDRVDVKAVNLVHPTIIDENGDSRSDVEAELANLRTQRAVQDVFLPRMQMNYRFTDNFVLRGAYFQTVARPTIEQLSTDVNLSLDLSPFAGGGPNFDQPLLQVFQGNAGLKPAITHNFDLSLERYFQNVGAVSLGLFYKRISNELTDEVSDTTSDLANIDLPDNPIFQNLPPNLDVQATRPVNSTNPASIWGLELAGEYRLTWLPGLLSGLGLSANYTYTRSKRVQQYFWFGSPVFDSSGAFIGRQLLVTEFPGTQFAQQPHHSGTIAVTYNKYGIDASLAYTYQARRQSFFQPHGLTVFNEPVDSLDLRLEYQFQRGQVRYRIYLEGADLLHGPTDPSVESSAGGQREVPFYLTGGSFLGGRSVRAGIAASF
jgi:TonB-dependent receptor